ncbi:MAG: MFS transporter [Nitrospinota bacterium]
MMNHFKEARAKPMYAYLMALNVAMAIGFQSWRILLNNFAVEEVYFDGSQIGILQSVREVPGLMVFLVVYVLLVMRECRLAALSIILLGIGVGLTGMMPSFSGLLFTTVLMSLGFHYFETVNQSLTLQHFGKESSAWVIGKMKSYISATNIAVGGSVLLLTYLLDYRYVFIAAGAPLIFIGLWALTQRPEEKDVAPRQNRLALKKAYWLYYALALMGGARRQIFVVFAVFLLVEKFRFSVHEVAALFVLNNFITYFVAPVAGRLIIKYGEKRMLMLEYASLFIVFMGYAFLSSPWAVAFLYITDHLFFSLNIAVNTFFQKIADPKDIAPGIAVGFSINHIAAVIIPAAFGLLWLVDYRIPFVLGAVMAIGSLLLSTLIKLPAGR